MANPWVRAPPQIGGITAQNYVQPVGVRSRGSASLAKGDAQPVWTVESRPPVDVIDARVRLPRIWPPARMSLN